MKKEELRVIPSKNYIILGIVIIVTILLQYYFYMWVNIYNESKINKPILEDIGMKKEAVLKERKIDEKTGEKLDRIIYSSFKDEYIKNKMY